MTKQKRSKKQKIEKKSNWLVRIYRFFVPRNFGVELQKGRQLGAQPGQTIGNAMFQLGKKARKAVDPEHKIKIGDQKEGRKEAEKIKEKK